MTEVGSLKWIEVVLLLAAGGLFVWWQLRDLRRAKEESRARGEQPQAPADTKSSGEPPP
jgi:hypothetical protein